MSLGHSPLIVTNGLTMYLDAANRKSQIGAVNTSVINTNLWSTGSGSSTGYGQNGNTNENTRLYDTDPWGNQSLVWGTYASGDGNADGGWNTDMYSIDKTKLYRFSVWVRRTSSTAAGTFYFGTNSDDGVYSTSDGGLKGNPYWECIGTSGISQNQWYLVCGHIYPYDTSYTGNHPNSGYYTVQQGATNKISNLNYCNIGSDLKWGPNSTTAQHRTYHYYCGDSTTRLQFAWPRMDKCDGTEPSISELLTKSPNIWYDLSGNNNNAIMYNSPINSGSTIQFNGSNYAYVSSINYATGPYTIMAASRYTGGMRGRMVTAFNNNWLLGHWGTSTENYYAEGWVTPTNAGSNDTSWRILTGSGNSLTDSWSMYVNGALTYTNSGGSAGPNGILVPGAGGVATEQSIGECSVILAYNRQLSLEEVKQNFNALRGRFSI